jgi:hypothetical protein
LIADVTELEVRVNRCNDVIHHEPPPEIDGAVSLGGDANHPDDIAAGVVGALFDTIENR